MGFLKTTARALLGACLVSQAICGAASAKDFSITLAAGHPPITKGVSLLHDFFIPEVNKRLKPLGHSITWNEAYGGSLVGVNEVLEGVENGITDFGYVPTLFEADKLPLQQITYVTPFGSADVVTLTKVMDALYAKAPEMNAAWAKYNQKVLATVVADNYVLLTTFPWTDVKELKGHKIATGGLATNWLRGTGAVPLSGSLPEYYNAVKTGLAEGIIIFESGIAPYKFYEVAPRIAKINYGTQAASALSVNLDVWKQFPPEMQKVIEEVAHEYQIKAAEGYQMLAETSLKKAVAGGATITDFPADARKAYAAAMPNIAKEWASNLDKRGVPASKVLATYLEAAKAAGVVYARDWLKD